MRSGRRGGVRAREKGERKRRLIDYDDFLPMLIDVRFCEQDSSASTSSIASDTSRARNTQTRVMRARVGDGDGDAARSLLNLAMITPGNSPTLWTALVDYGADSDEEALLSD
eukprot:gene25826-31600_t